MKAMKSNKLTKAILVTLVLLVTAPSAFAYPPDNAAVLYYKASMLYQVDDEMSEMLSHLGKGEIELNEKVKEFVKKNQKVINTVLDASEVKHCDWGLDYSQGCMVSLVPFGKLKQLTLLILADARIFAQQGDYETAISRCISVFKIARHVNDRNFISYLVGTAINGITNNCVMQIMSDMPQDMENLGWLKNQLLQIDSIPFSIKPALYGEWEAGTISMSPERIGDVVRSFDEGVCKEKILESIRSADEQFFDKNRAYWNNYMEEVTAAFDLPYEEGYLKFKKLEEELSKEDDKNPDATLTAAFAPASSKIYSLATRLGSHSNAIKTAIEIYIIKARTGKLPVELPAGLPKDLFSGEDFEYEKTADGFILRCRGKELGKDKIYEYEFKVKK